MEGRTGVTEVFGVCSQLLWWFAECPHWTLHVLLRPCCPCPCGDGDRSGSSCRFSAGDLIPSHSLCTGQCHLPGCGGSSSSRVSSVLRAPEQRRTTSVQRYPDLWLMASGSSRTNEVIPCALKVSATPWAQRSVLPSCWSHFLCPKSCIPFVLAPSAWKLKWWHHNNTQRRLSLYISPLLPHHVETQTIAKEVQHPEKQAADTMGVWDTDRAWEYELGLLGMTGTVLAGQRNWKAVVMNVVWKQSWQKSWGKEWVLINTALITKKDDSQLKLTVCSSQPSQQVQNHALVTGLCSARLLLISDSLFWMAAVIWTFGCINI